MTLKNNRAPLLYYTKLCASFQSHRGSQTWVTVRYAQVRSKSVIFLSCVTLKFDGWPWKSIGHIFYATLSFVHHLIAIDEFKLGLQSRNSQFGSNLGFFAPCDFGIWQMTLKNSYATSSFVHHYIMICELKMELRSGNGEIGFWPLWLRHLISDLDLLYGHHCDRDLWPLTLIFCMGITIVNGNNSWKFHTDTIRI